MNLICKNLHDVGMSALTNKYQDRNTIYLLHRSLLHECQCSLTCSLAVSDRVRLISTRALEGGVLTDSLDGTNDR